jgi:drug/metabolite transporter (DMT)-like permease
MSSPAEAAVSVPLTRRGMPPLILACLASVWLIWGSTYLAIKWALVSFPPFYQMGTRFLVAGALLAGWMRWRGSRWPERREWTNAVILGALMLAGGYGFTAVAETSVSSGLVVAFIAIGPALQAALEWPLGVRPTRLELAGITLGLAGVLGLAAGQGFSGSPGGLVAVAISLLCWKLGSVWTLHGMPHKLGGRRLSLSPGAMGYASQMLAGGGVLMALSLLVGERPAPITPLALASWTYLVVAGSLVAFSAFMLLLQRTSTAVSSSYAYVNPVIAMALGVTLGGETVTAAEWLSAGLVTTSVLLMVLGRR